MNFGLIKEAGLVQGEFADLLGVSRATVNTWVSTGRVSKFIRPVAKTYLDWLQECIKDEVLPQELEGLPPIGGNMEMRWEIIKKLWESRAAETA